MEIDPHTIQQILTRVREQLRCPQCRKRMEVDLNALKVMSNQLAVMQAQCDACDAHIMLHAAISTTEHDPEAGADGRNTSSRLVVDIEEIKMMQESLAKSEGSFTKIFEQTK